MHGSRCPGPRFETAGLAQSVTKLQARRVRDLNLSWEAKNFLSSKIYRRVLGSTQPFMQCVPAFFTED